MAFKVFISQSAMKEIKNAVDYYKLYSETAPINFISALNKTYHTLRINPFFNIKYENVRSIKINKFPYSLYFSVDEEKDTVRILSCFHNKRNPSESPKG